jgi:hypothetical protein
LISGRHVEGVGVEDIQKIVKYPRGRVLRSRSMGPIWSMGNQVWSPLATTTATDSYQFEFSNTVRNVKILRYHFTVPSRLFSEHSWSILYHSKPV